MRNNCSCHLEIVENFHDWSKTQDSIDVHLIEVPTPRRKDKVNQLIDLFSFGNLSLQNFGEMMTVL